MQSLIMKGNVMLDKKEEQAQKAVGTLGIYIVEIRGYVQQIASSAVAIKATSEQEARDLVQEAIDSDNYSDCEESPEWQVNDHYGIPDLEDLSISEVYKEEE